MMSASSPMRGEAVTVREMLEAHPHAATEDRDVLARCVEACGECATACTICADADFAEADASDMTLCARLDLDCADSCVAAGRIAARQTERDPAILRAAVEACRRACNACAQECERHAEHHEHCRICAGVCRRCEEACDALLAILA
jgi:hypothetical protein